MDKETNGTTFTPQEPSTEPPTFGLPNAKWTYMLNTFCTFEPGCFLEVMLDLIKNPNITSSHLFRADIFYDSLNDTSVSEDADSEHFSGFTKHMKAEYRPLRVRPSAGYERKRTLVRQMIPRNPKLDKPLVQTCHLLESHTETESPSKDRKQENIVLYLPHATSPEAIPWYHPTVQGIALTHSWNPESQLGELSLHYWLFPDFALDTRMQRTALNLLQTVHKHGQGRLAGYVKRVHHDQIVPQAALQNTYTRLKAKYAKELIDNWVEQTPAGKHVFEDLGIAAFLIELWSSMYHVGDGSEGTHDDGSEGGKRPFPGFVDIGCGNGVLVYLLLQEGFHGYGFDARRRKTWGTFPEETQRSLREMILVPEIFISSANQDLLKRKSMPPHDMSTHSPGDDQGNTDSADCDDMSQLLSALSLHTSSTSPHLPIHNGTFPPGTFIISNHADQLTAWTPLLAYLSDSPFVAIPCCSYNLAGVRFRAPVPSKDTLSSRANESNSENRAETRKETHGDHSGSLPNHVVKSSDANSHVNSRPKLTPKPPSAYASLYAYVATLTSAVGYTPEREMLRIPSTRNAAVLGRKRACGPDEAKEGGESRERKVRDILERELNKDGGLQKASREWIQRAAELATGKGKGH